MSDFTPIREAVMKLSQEEAQLLLPDVLILYDIMRFAHKEAHHPPAANHCTLSPCIDLWNEALDLVGVPEGDR